MEKTTLASIALLAFTFAISLYFYPAMPGQMAIHWGLSGPANGYAGRDFGLFFLPLLSIFLLALLIYLPRTDPLQENVRKNSKTYGWLVFSILAFLLYVHLLVIGWNAGAVFSMGQMVSLGLAFLFYAMGWAMGKLERNWFAGIRTPWTINDDLIWKKTHQLGGKLFKACAAFAAIGTLFGESALLLSIAAAIASGIACVIYSYLEYLKIHGGKKSRQK